ncbi:MAG: exonuclease domain-containing protein [Saprospiraceae bacterium]
MTNEYKFAVIDIETTGAIFQRDKIIEIAIIIIENGKETSRYSTLINPERSIPIEITRITGINNDMIAQSPKFYEVAKEIIQYTESCIFVAHNVHFDYSFIQYEFEQLGYNYQRKKLCTLQLSKRNFKGLHSYSLGNLINYFDIQVEHRHRALDDAYASSVLLLKILDLNIDYSLNEPAIKSLLKDIKYPPNVNPSIISNLPEKCGVYTMRNEHGDPVYIGKSKNIHGRIQQHFAQMDSKTNKMHILVHDIDFELTGSELMASLVESKSIKQYSPEINKAQRNKKESICIYYTLHDRGFYQLKSEHIDIYKQDVEYIIRYSASKNIAKNMISFLITKYQLCQSANQTKSTKFSICAERLNNECFGICEGKEDQEVYNQRFLTMIEENTSLFDRNFILYDKGRRSQEMSCIVIKDGYCRAIGYLNIEESYLTVESIIDELSPYKGSIETNSIIRTFIKNNPKIKLKYF